MVLMTGSCYRPVTKNYQSSTHVIKEKTKTCIYHFYNSITFSVVGRILNDVVNRLPNLENKKDTKDLQVCCIPAAFAEVSRYCGYTCGFLCRK